MMYYARAINDNGYAICVEPLEALTLEDARREAADWVRGWARYELLNHAMERIY